MVAPKAIKAFYGARTEHEHERAAARAATAKAHIGTGERPQEVFTPEIVLRVLRQAWGRIALDPCGHPDALVGADETWTGYQAPTGRTGKHGPILEWAGPGLSNPWRDRTFWNPPFSDLQRWIEHAGQQPGRWCGLFPARTSREWCLDLLYRVDGICWLRPLTFEGFDQANPDRLVLAYRGPDVAQVAACTPPELGRWSGPLVAL